MSAVVTTPSKLEQLQERLKQAQRAAAGPARKAQELEPQLAEVTRQLANAKTQLDVTLRAEILQGKKANTASLEEHVAHLENRHRIVDALVREARAAAEEAYRPVVALQAQLEDEETAEHIADLNSKVSMAHANLTAAREAFDRAEQEYRKLQSELSAAYSRRMVSQHERSKLPPGVAPHRPFLNTDPEVRARNLGELTAARGRVRV